MKTFSLLGSLLCGLMVLPLQGCDFNSDTKANTNYITRSFPVESFTDIESNLTADIEITQAPDCTVSATGPDNILPDLEVSVEEGTLHLSLDKKWKQLFNRMKKQRLTLHITLPDLHSVTLGGVGDILLPDTCHFDQLYLKLTGVGDIVCKQLSCKELKAKLSGVGDIRLSGSCSEASYHNSGVGDIQAKRMEAATTTVDHSGVGDVRCLATEAITIKSSGVGDVHYYGNPPAKKIKKSGVGSVTGK